MRTCLIYRVGHLVCSLCSDTEPKMQGRKLSLFLLCLLPFAIAFPDPLFRTHDLNAHDPQPESVSPNPAHRKSLEARGGNVSKGMFSTSTSYRPSCKPTYTSGYCHTYCTCTSGKELQCQRSPGDMKDLEKLTWVREWEEVCQRGCKCKKSTSRRKPIYKSTYEGSEEVSGAQWGPHLFHATSRIAPVPPPLVGPQRKAPPEGRRNPLAPFQARGRFQQQF